MFLSQSELRLVRKSLVTWNQVYSAYVRVVVVGHEK
ncbi:hypothetical protein FHR87_003711 [Azomonas macrocytogenes]|uniref:Uncharacterized protein n=1 Tax=Azomonas macrocytogenes TaxID=69962 RepID=A0A839TB45_AZOMA|nr:hypothetical protein [Azomonas macrocytogenes]